MAHQSPSSLSGECTTNRSLSSRITDFIIANLREEYPYMPINAVHEAAVASMELLDQKIQNQQPTIKASKQRSDFLTLSPELRNRIYYLALRPQHSGEGGIDASRAIYLGADDLDRTHSKEAASERGYRTTPWINQPPLTKLSRQIRAEALPVYYGINHFVMEVGKIEVNEKRIRLELDRPRNGLPLPFDSYPFGPITWLHHIGPSNVAMIKHLDVVNNKLVGQHATDPTIPIRRPKIPSSAEEVKQYFALRGTPLPCAAKYLGKYVHRTQVRRRKGSRVFTLWCPLTPTAPSSAEVTEQLGTDDAKDTTLTLAYDTYDRRECSNVSTLKAHLRGQMKPRFSWEDEYEDFSDSDPATE